MKQHQYRITIEHLTLPDGMAAPASAPLVLEVGSHDNLADIVARALSKRADLRYQDGDEFARDLLAIAASVPDEALSSQLSSSADSDAAMQRTTPQTPTVRISR